MWRAVAAWEGGRLQHFRNDNMRVTALLETTQQQVGWFRGMWQLGRGRELI